ncbi:hypothetical protein APICC_08563 [Apis cerana cerana]|uniref:Uncharacterized protein n=1 Tax=Apis cerana cerana TaxID=94128 RepID=A0A2A3E846_APICC|nr:hypothetical protein APICC_08563 [Apis cerana cerana]
MTTETSGEVSCLERLHQEAFNCLDTFPNKIVELNSFVNEYMPESVKNNKYDDTIPIEGKVKCQSTISTSKNCDLNSISDYGGITGCNVRRRPGPLGQLLAFLFSTLATCTKKIVIAPSQYIVDNIIPTFFQRRELKNAQCGPSSNWSSSLSTYVTTLKKDTTVIGKLIDIMRPAVVKLITDTTIVIIPPNSLFYFQFFPTDGLKTLTPVPVETMAPSDRVGHRVAPHRTNQCDPQHRDHRLLGIRAVLSSQVPSTDLSDYQKVDEGIHAVNRRVPCTPH